MFKVVSDRHSTKTKKVVFIKDEVFEGMYPSPSVDVYFKQKLVLLGMLLIITCEAIMLYIKRDEQSVFFLVITIIMCFAITLVMFIFTYSRHDVRYHDNEYENSDVLKFYALTEFSSTIYVGLTYDEITVIMPTKYSNNEVLKYTNYSGTRDFVSIFDEVGVVNFNESFHKAVSKVRNNFRCFDNYLVISYQIDDMVKDIIKCVKPLLYCKEEK